MAGSALDWPRAAGCGGIAAVDQLDVILAAKRQEIAPRLRSVTAAELAAAGAAPRPSFLRTLAEAPGGLGIIAEIKRRSPSAGKIADIPSAPAQAERYHAAGADALSVLTDEPFFGGSLEDLRAVNARFRAAPPGRPTLRKDFLLHPIQVLEAAEAGASAVLLIVRALDDAALATLAGAAADAGLDALFEVHEEAEIERALRAGARLIGVNNRDLAVFRTDLGLSERLLPLLPSGVLGVSESGIHTGADAARVRRAGARAVLVGEALMRAGDPGALVAALRAP